LTYTLFYTLKRFPAQYAYRLIEEYSLNDWFHKFLRTLQDWRTKRQIAYIALGEKTLYRKSDIQAMLEKNQRKAFE
jgi:hypothetical protein